MSRARGVVVIPERVRSAVLLVDFLEKTKNAEVWGQEGAADEETISRLCTTQEHLLLLWSRPFLLQQTFIFVSLGKHAALLPESGMQARHGGGDRSWLGHCPAAVGAKFGGHMPCEHSTELADLLSVSVTFFLSFPRALRPPSQLRSPKCIRQCRHHRDSRHS